MPTPSLRAALLILVASPLAAEELTLENVTAPGAVDAGEAVAESFSLDAAARYLDQSSLDWVKNRKCFTCHTNFAYLVARPAVSHQVPAHRQIRQALEQMVEQRWPEAGPRWDAEVVMSAAVLALNDRHTSGKLHATTRKALDRMWTLQREDGGFEWLKCNWPPMESDDHFGATMAAIAVGAAPGDYRNSQAARQGLEGLRRYFRENDPPTLHHQAMLLWADTLIDDVLSDAQRSQVVKQLLDAQKDDGGWALASWGDWTRADGKEQDTESSDGYATGFAIYVLRCADVPADHRQLKRGIAWLKSHQRASGRWFTRSLNRDNKHFISNAGTAFAVLALQACR